MGPPWKEGEIRLEVEKNVYVHIVTQVKYIYCLQFQPNVMQSGWRSNLAVSTLVRNMKMKQIIT